MLTHFAQNKTKPDPAKASCIRRLFTPASDGQVSKGTQLLALELRKIRSENLLNARFEAVLLGVADRECPSS
jgi:hypothetical protein